MRSLALALALALAPPALAQERLPPPPPPPADDEIPLPPPPPGTVRRPALEQPARPPPPPATAGPGRAAPVLAPPEASGARGPTQGIGEGPIAPAGAQAASLQPDESVAPWRMSLASGVLGRFGGHAISSRRENPSTLIYFGAQADGAWSQGYGQAARLRLQVLTGGEDEIYLPSDGEVEAAYLIGRREFRFVIGRIEVARYPGLALQTLAQLATLPSVEGTIPLAGDRMRLSYAVSPVEMAWVYYYGGAHIPHSADVPTESDEPAAASAGRLRYTVLLPPSVLLSLQGDLLKMWSKPDLLVAGEGSLGYQVLDGSVLFNATVRWNSYTRRSRASATATERSSDLRLLGVATLVF